MMVLTRLCGEFIVVTLADGRTVRVGVAEAGRGKCRLGIEADRDIGIVRAELLTADERAKVEANIRGAGVTGEDK